MFRSPFHFVHASYCVYWWSETLHRDFVLILLSSRVIKNALILWIYHMWLDPCPDVCGNVTMNILCENMRILVLLNFDSSLLREFWSVSISSLRKVPKVIMIIVCMIWDTNLRDGYSLILIIWQSDMRSWLRVNFWNRSRNDRQTLDIVRVSVEFHQSNAISFKWSDQFSKFHNRWEYDSLLELSVGIRPGHSSWSVVLVPDLLVVSLSLGRSAIQYSMILLAITSDFHVRSHRVHYNILPLSSHASDSHNLQSLYDVDECNLYLP